MKKVASIFRPQSGIQWSGGTFPKPTGLFPKNEYAEASGEPSQDFTSRCSNRKQFWGTWHRRKKARFIQPTGRECTENQKETMWGVKAIPVLGSRLVQHRMPVTLWTTPCYHKLPTALVSLFLNPLCEQHRARLVPVSTH